MKRNERTKKLLEILNTSKEAVSGTALSKELGVSRQVIVQDIMLLRSKGADIVSTNRGYLLNKKEEFTRVFKLQHSDEDARRELELIVDLGGRILDVFIYHAVYDVVRAKMNIKSRKDVADFMAGISGRSSSFLKNTTNGYHYHTVAADSKMLLDIIENELKNAGFLAEPRGYEPYEFKEKGKRDDE